MTTNNFQHSTNQIGVQNIKFMSLIPQYILSYHKLNTVFLLISIVSIIILFLFKFITFALISIIIILYLLVLNKRNIFIYDDNFFIQDGKTERWENYEKYLRKRGFFGKSLEILIFNKITNTYESITFLFNKDANQFEKSCLERKLLKVK